MTDPMSEEINFKLNGGEFIELKNLLKVTGLCGSGGAAKIAIEQEEVQVDGLVETRKACKIRAGQTVEFEHNTIKVLA